MNHMKVSVSCLSFCINLKVGHFFELFQTFIDLLVFNVLSHEDKSYVFPYFSFFYSY